ncbi:MAG: efflux transporter periplasmic adaptor subunit [Syntrophobacterales bacterium GWC2_56_13]|nr:MAG: efflux transporter periplasmic adaptor subunit [Syntrophobacterales bacterium GWC2_56_13]OHE19865.1 MAG: efflux transporter periplasmic adaptor subunit [Syntrophobacterales bacterium GWF2_56_9]
MKMILVMVIMLLIVGLIFGGIFGYKAFLARMSRRAMATQKMPPVTVTAVKAGVQTWQPQLQAVGSLRAVRGVDVTSEIAGLVRSVQFRPGEEVKEGQILVQLNADADIAQLRSLEAAAGLAQIVYDRDKKQYAVQAVSQATLDADAADLKSKQAQVAQQAAIVEKKTIHAPFAGRLGISTVNPGQYVNPGDRIVTLQSLDTLYLDFYLPQQELSQISRGQPVAATTDTYPGRTFSGLITTINPKVETDSRNVQVEATFFNPRHELLPGMFASVRVRVGAAQRYLTLPQTAVSYNPYGETVYIIEGSGKGPDGKPILTVRQTFATVGSTRGDQIAILSGIKAGDMVVTSGQLKLKTGSAVIVNNQVQPSNDAAPKPVDQ